MNKSKNQAICIDKQAEFDAKLLAEGVPQSALDRCLPKLDGDLVWNADKFRFESQD